MKILFRHSTVKRNAQMNNNECDFKNFAIASNRRITERFKERVCVRERERRIFINMSTWDEKSSTHRHTENYVWLLNWFVCFSSSENEMAQIHVYTDRVCIIHSMNNRTAIERNTYMLFFFWIVSNEFPFDVWLTFKSRLLFLLPLYLFCYIF